MLNRTHFRRGVAVLSLVASLAVAPCAFASGGGGGGGTGGGGVSAPAPWTSNAAR